MSASLVGSEMCIRDSCARGDSAAPARSPSPTPGRQTRKRHSAWASSCLLYTSDAAEDMQCVDLG
eukprot:3538414-Alexandrium_andersonii.AAC.1